MPKNIEVYKNTDIDIKQLQIFYFYNDFTQHRNFIKYTITPDMVGRYDLISYYVYNTYEYAWIIPLFLGTYLWDDRSNIEVYLPTIGDIEDFMDYINVEYINYLPARGY